MTNPNNSNNLTDELNDNLGSGDTPDPNVNPNAKDEAEANVNRKPKKKETQRTKLKIERAKNNKQLKAELKLAVSKCLKLKINKWPCPQLTDLESWEKFSDKEKIECIFIHLGRNRSKTRQQYPGIAATWDHR